MTDRPSHFGKPLTAHEIDTIMRLHESGVEYTVIAEVLKRNETTIWHCVQKEREKQLAPSPQIQIQKMRKCLSCGIEFLSEWAGNRRCQLCRSHDGEKGALDVHISLSTSYGYRK